MSIALYRRYRPEKFADVVGQEHVTGPLRQALRADRIHHAYLFSGPRGCGKTTSARILARTLNCATRRTAVPGQMPDEPCGQCPSCIDLSASGGGSLDVIEIDAASHNGVDDARELRERAVFAPVRDTYKVFVIDEAHMVTPAGFNALLKIVEEPPPHVRFIFATTEPEKVIGTIRSRTHHYPFRLIGASTLTEHLARLCDQEGFVAHEGVLPLVVRAGAGSARDAMSVLDQLMAGAAGNELTYEHTISLLGFTDSALLDDTIDALSGRVGAAAFAVVDRVIGSGHDPRRFVEDLLERLRDLIIVRATGDGAAAVLREVPSDQLGRLVTQAQQLGPAELSRSADVVNQALSELVGATTPRLHLELLMARLLLPGSDADAGLGARLDRLERGLPAAPVPAAGAAATPVAPVAPGSAGQSPAAASPTAPPPVAPAAPPAPTPAQQPQPPVPSAAAAPGPVAPAATPVSAPAQIAPPVAPSSPTAQSVSTTSPAVAGANSRQQSSRPAPASAGGDHESVLRQHWATVLETAKSMRRTTWSALQHAQVGSVTGNVATLVFSNDGALRMFTGRSNHAELTSTAIAQALHIQLQVKAVSQSSDGAGVSSGSVSYGPGGSGAPVEVQRPPVVSAPAPAASSAGQGPSAAARHTAPPAAQPPAPPASMAAGGSAPAASPHTPSPQPPSVAVPPVSEPSRGAGHSPVAAPSAGATASPQHSAPGGAASGSQGQGAAATDDFDGDDAPSMDDRDDPNGDSLAVSGESAIAQILGGTVLEVRDTR